MDRQESSALLRAARQGSPAALEALYSRFGGKLLALIRLRLGSGLRAHLESRDILQATLLKSFQRIDQFESSDSASLLAWLARIAQNEINDQADYHARKRRDGKANVPLDEGTEAAASPLRSAVSQMILDERAHRLERAMESLDEHYREVILLRYFEELSYKEMARRLGKSEDACRMLLARALVALTLKLAEER